MRLLWLGSLLTCLAGVILASLPSHAGRRGVRSDIERVTRDLRRLVAAAVTFQAAHDDVPDTDLQALLEAHDGRGPLMAPLPQDPWGRACQLERVSESKRGFLICCAGADGVFKIDDDIVWPQRE